MYKSRRSIKKLISSKFNVSYERSVMQMRCDEKIQNRDVFDRQIGNLRDIVSDFVYVMFFDIVNMQNKRVIRKK